MLSERLHLLEQKGFVFRHYEPTIPPAVTYGLTKRMKNIGKVLEGLNRLAQKWQQEDLRVERSHGKPVTPGARELQAVKVPQG